MIYCVNSFVGWILESDILDGCVGYKYPTYGCCPAYCRASRPVRPVRRVATRQKSVGG